MMDAQKLNRRAVIFKAMAHPSRLLIMEILAAGPASVTELTLAVGDTMSTVSRHLSILKSAGIIDSQRCANQILYSLKIPCVLEFCQCIEREVQAGNEDIRPCTCQAFSESN